MLINIYIIIEILLSIMIFVIILYADTIAIQVLKIWNMGSTSEMQLQLEKKEYLASLLIRYLFWIKLFSLGFFVFLVNNYLPQFIPGAMCATGTLSANTYGYKSIVLKIITIFFVSGWLLIHQMDYQTINSPLKKIKSTLILVLTPLLWFELKNEILYFWKLNVFSSVNCCSLYFNIQPDKLISSLQSIPQILTAIVFYIATITILFISFLILRNKIHIRNGSIITCISLIYFIISLISIISLFSIYFYELPTHHCPFDILNEEYYYLGYPIYFGLFWGSISSMKLGLIPIISKWKKMSSFKDYQKRLAIQTLLGICLFTVLSSIPFIRWILFNGNLL